MANETKQAACRFCGQQLLVENAEEMTQPQLEEAATMRCECDLAKSYQETANRRKTARNARRNYSEKVQGSSPSQKKCWI